MIIAGCKDTLRGQGLDTPEIQRLPAALAVRPSFRPDLNLTKENTSSYCVAINPQQQRTGWYTAAPLEHSLQMHRELTETEEQVEMQLKPAYIWHNEQQQPCKYAMVQLQASDAEQDKQTLRFHPSPLWQGSMRSHSAWLGCEMMTTHSCASPIYRTYIHKLFGNSHLSQSKTLRAYVQLLQQSTWHTYGNQPLHRKPLVGVPFPPRQQRPRCMPTSDV